MCAWARTATTPRPLTNPSRTCQFGVGSEDTTRLFDSGVLPGLICSEFPSDSTESPALKVGPFSSFANTGFYQNRLNPSTNVIFAKGNHTIVAGGGYSYTQLNITNNRTGIAQVTTKNFEDFSGR